MPSISMARISTSNAGAKHSASSRAASGTLEPSMRRIFCGFYGPSMLSNSRSNPALQRDTKPAAAHSRPTLLRILRQQRDAGIQQPARWQMAPWRSLRHAPRACPLPRGRCCATACMLLLPACHATLPPSRRVPPMGLNIERTDRIEKIKTRVHAYVTEPPLLVRRVRWCLVRRRPFPTQSPSQTPLVGVRGQAGYPRPPGVPPKP